MRQRGLNGMIGTHLEGSGQRKYVDDARDHEQEQEDAAEPAGQFLAGLALGFRFCLLAGHSISPRCTMKEQDGGGRRIPPAACDHLQAKLRFGDLVGSANADRELGLVIIVVVRRLSWTSTTFQTGSVTALFMFCAAVVASRS